jgi:hypothetical protein
MDGIVTGLGQLVPSLTKLGLSQINASEHTPLVVWWRWRGSPLVGSTSYPPHR